MSFMYLELSYDDEDHGVRVKVTKTSTPLRRTVGSENARVSGAFAIYAIEGFDGLENIDDEEILQELLRRFPAERIIELLSMQLPKSVLLAELERRIAR